MTASGSFDRGTVTWQWQRCATTCASIASATHSTYVPQAADVGQRLQVTATATNGTGATPSTSALTSAVTAPAPKPTPIAPKPTPVATPTPKPAPTPIAKPAAPASPKLSLYRPHRRGSKLAISGRVVRSFHGKVTVKLCAGRHCSTVRLRVRNGAFSAKLRPPRHGRIVITATVPASAGHRAGHAKRTVRF